MHLKMFWELGVPHLIEGLLKIQSHRLRWEPCHSTGGPDWALGVKAMGTELGGGALENHNPVE